MNILSIEDLEIYKNHEREFTTSLYYDYKRNTSSKDCLQLAEIYEKVTGQSVTRNFSCASCQLTLFKQLARLYFDSIAYYKEQEEKEAEIQAEMLKNAKTEEVTIEPVKQKTKKSYNKKKS